MSRILQGMLALVVLGGAIFIVIQSGQSPDANGDNPDKEPQSSYTMKESADIAREWMRTQSPTYTFDGSELTLTEQTAMDTAGCESCYQFTFTFISNHGGFGDRSGEPVTQVITPHITTVTVESGEVTQAVTDNEYNELTNTVRQGGQGVDRLQPQLVELYYYNKAEDEADSQIDCNVDSVKPIERVIPAKEPIRETIELLVQGDVRPAEREQGFETEFPHEEFSLQNMELNDGTLTLTFPEVPGFTSGGSCRTGLLRAQIEKTAQQFPEVDSVVIQPETLFQP